MENMREGEKQFINQEESDKNKEKLSEDFSNDDQFSKENVDNKILNAENKQKIEEEDKDKLSEIKKQLGIEEEVEKNGIEELVGLIEKATKETVELEKNVKWVNLEDIKFDENKYYRVINKAGFIDFLETGIVRSKSIAKPLDKFKKATLLDLIKDRPTPFPSFAKGSPDFTYLKKNEENYILESDIPMYKQGDKDPDGKKIASRHWAYRPLEKNGEYKKELKKEEITNIYKIDKEGKLYKKEDVE